VGFKHLKVFCQLSNPSYRSANEPIKLIEKVGRVGDYAKSMFGRIQYPTDAGKFTVGDVCGEDFGLTGEMKIYQLFEAFQKGGMIMLPQTVAAELVYKQSDNFKAEGWHRIYMKPIWFGGFNNVFRVQRMLGELEVHEHPADPGSEVYFSHRWLVGLPTRNT